MMKKWPLFLIIVMIILYNSLNFLNNSEFLNDLNQKSQVIEIKFSYSNISQESQEFQSTSVSENLIEITRNEDKVKNKQSTDSNDEKNPSSEFLKHSFEPFTNMNTLAEDQEPLKATSCRFPEYSFTSQEEALIWKYKEYSQCSTESNDTILIENDQLFVECESKRPPEFFEEMTFPERLGGSRKILGIWSPSVPDLTKKNFTFIKCQEKSIYSYVFMRNSVKISEKAKKQAETLKPLQDQQMSILLLTLDSVSRGSASRNLKKTLKMLKTESSKFNFYDFLNPATSGIHTIDNMAPIIYGESRTKVEETLGTRSPTFHSKLHLEYQQKAIWSHFSRLGYVTMFLHDTVWDYLTFITGVNILCDHVFTNYWKVVWTVYGFDDFQAGQKCIGNQNSHNISFGYTFKFFEVYPDNNKFAYVHLDAAHENKGNIRTVDDDLQLFLESLVDLFDKRNESFVVFLIGDHGQRRTEIQFDIRNSYEGKQPMSFILTDKKLACHEILSHNQENLFSRFDLHLSLKDISYYPYSNMNDEHYQSLSNNYEAADVKSLFREKTSSLRTCQDLKIPDVFCPCNSFERADTPADLRLLEKAFLPIVFKVFAKINRDKNCGNSGQPSVYDYQKFVSSSIEEGFDVLYILRVKVNETKASQFRIRGCTERKIMETKNVLQGMMFESIVYVYERLRMFYQVYEVSGSGPCGDIIPFNN